MDTISAVLANPKYHDVLSIIKGCRNGAVYGAKIRFPHALVMTFLFRDDTFKNKCKIVLDATKAHSRNLAFFVTIYKTLLVVLRRAVGKETSSHAFIAGVVGGYVVFGENNNINNQIVLYLFSRILVGLAKLAEKKQLLKSPVADPFALFAAAVWGVVMWLFRHHRETLQASLQASMQYLYNDSEVWNGVRNWIWHNK